MLAILKRLVELDRFVLPPLCAFCRLALKPGERGICRPCRADLPYNVPCCRACALPLGNADETAVCASCQARPLPVSRIIAPLSYEFPVDAAIRALKYRRRLEFVPSLSSVMQRAWLDARLEVDLFVPVPLHYGRHGLRGFNQAAELAAPIAERASVPLCSSVERVQRTAPQTGLGRAERRRNVRRAFRCKKPIVARHALIVDDVMTTGSTVLELAECLQQSNVDEVSVLVAARATPQR